MGLRKCREAILTYLGKQGGPPGDGGSGGKDVKAEALRMSRTGSGVSVTQAEQTTCAKAGS